MNTYIRRKKFMHRFIMQELYRYIIENNSSLQLHNKEIFWQHFDNRKSASQNK